MKRYSASYIYNRSNFVLIGCDEPVCEENAWFDLACVVINILQRGTPSPAPKKLEALLGEAPVFEGRSRPIRRLITHELRWSKTIKGAPDGRSNPALKFYKELLPNALPTDLRYLVSYVLPEALIADIIDDCDSRFIEQRVDFYCPRARLAIEIDGSQHGQAAQAYLDIERDMYLAQNGIETIRITTSELDASKAASALIERFDFGYDSGVDTDGQTELAAFGYEIAMRAQIAIAECVRTGILDLSQPQWEIELVHDQPGIDCEALFRAAADDVLDIFENLCVLRNYDFTRPVIVLRKSADDLCLDLSATKSWSELESSSGVVYARNDYFEDKDNFQISCGKPITYATDMPERSDQVKGALRYFLYYLFRYPEFHKGQLGIIKNALARKPTLGILPTGAGKSLCYQIACLLQPCISFVVCPIISLIQDQDRNARESGICRVGMIQSQMDRQDKNKVLDEFGRRRYQFIWIAPERFQMKDFRERLREIGMDASFGYAVIDEVHCLSEWGHDFRVSYLRLYDTIQKYCSGAPIIGLTATASRQVLADLLVELQIKRSDVKTSPSLDREELTYHVVSIQESQREAELARIFDEVDRTFREREHVEDVFKPAGEDSICGIVFCNTKSNSRRPYASCAGVVDLLKDRDVKAGEYHSGIGDGRRDVQQQFIDNDFTVMAATKAFGMGVNKKNVRYTIHNGLPWSIEAFYQEAGRAGRDEKRNASECYILYSSDSPQDVVEKVFARNTSIGEIRELTDDLGGDLGTLFFLWSGSHEDVDVEAQAIIGVFKELMRRRDQSGMAVIEFNLVKTLAFDVVKAKAGPGDKVELHMNTQDALYKLALLGIVKDWTVDYRTKTYEVSVENIDSTSESFVKGKLEGYVRRHGSRFSFDSKSDLDKVYIDAYESAPEGNKLIGIIKALLLWTNDNIVYTRRRAIWNIFDLCNKGPGKDDFRNYINNFFQLNTESDNQLEAIVGNADDIDLWIRLFTRLDDNPQVQEEHLKDLKEMESISNLCDRYRESYPANIGLEWATMVARLLSDGFSRDETVDLFGFISSEIGNYAGLDRDILFNRTIELAKNASSDAKDAFGAAVVTHAAHRAHDTYEQLGDAVTLEYLVTMATADLRRIWGRTSR